MKKLMCLLLVSTICLLMSSVCIAEVDESVFDAFQEKLFSELEGTAEADCRYIPAGDAICITLAMSGLSEDTWKAMDYNTQLQAMDIFQSFVVTITDTSEQLFENIPILIIFQSQDGFPVDAYINRAQITWILD